MPARSRKSFLFLHSAVLIISASLLNGCASQRVARELTQVENISNLNPKKKYLKVHLTDGRLYVLHTWRINSADRKVIGLGNYLDVNRRIIESRGSSEKNQKVKGNFQSFLISYDDIVIIETNDKGKPAGLAALLTVGALTTTASIFCVANPKACFGSCPTFYIEHDTVSKLVAEGFSSSIGRALQEKDVDLINFPMQKDSSLKITVKNEALETHMIQKISLLVVPKDPASKVLQEMNGDFYEVSNIQSPITTEWNRTDILRYVKGRDEWEWFSLADSFDLTAKEEIFLEFPNPGKEIAFIIDKRQTLMTTFLFYHSLALMGRGAAYYMTQMETSKPYLRKRVTHVYDLLGGIDIYVANQKGSWDFVNSVREAGPIVSDTHLVRIPPVSGETVKVRLRMTKGLWRINSTSVANVKKKVIPQRLAPALVTKDGVADDSARLKMTGSKDYLVTFPGDVYDIMFDGEYTSDNEYFIESEGYYIEWMREEWLRDENIRQVKRIIMFPSAYLKRMAAHYKIAEPQMEKTFWNSKYTSH